MKYLPNGEKEKGRNEKLVHASIEILKACYLKDKEFQTPGLSEKEQSLKLILFYYITARLFKKSKAT